MKMSNPHNEVNQVYAGYVQRRLFLDLLNCVRWEVRLVTLILFIIKNGVWLPHCLQQPKTLPQKTNLLDGICKRYIQYNVFQPHIGVFIRHNKKDKAKPLNVLFKIRGRVSVL